AERQAELNRSLDVKRLQDENRALANALTAELVAASAAVFNSFPMMELWEKMYTEMGDAKLTQPAKMSVILPRFDPRVYKANLSKIGLLGPSKAHDVVVVYGMLFIPDTLNDVMGMPANAFAQLVHGYIETYRMWLPELNHVISRLLAIDDPA